VYGLLFSLAVGAFAGGLWRGLGLGLWRAFKVADLQAAPAAQRSTHGHGDGLAAWRTHTDTRHSAGRHTRNAVPPAQDGQGSSLRRGRVLSALAKSNPIRSLSYEHQGSVALQRPHGTAMRYAGERRNLDESIEELRQLADGRNDILAEAAGIEAGSWYAWPSTMSAMS
jgi:hypothetical protein